MIDWCQLLLGKTDKTSTTRSTPSLPNKNIPPTIRKAPSGTSKQQKLESTAPADITTVTKTQYLLNERTKAFETLAPIKANDVAFPDISKTTGQGSAATSKLRTTASQDGQGTSTDRLNSEKEKKEHRGPVTIQYTLTSGLIIKYSDGRSAVEGAHSGSGVSLQQPRESVTYSAGTLHQQLSASRLDKTSTTRSTPSLPNKNIPPTIRKAPSGTSKQQKLESTAPADITTVTKTQYLLNERTKAFETLAPIKANDVAFPDISKTTGLGSAATSKLRTAASQDGQGTSTDRLNSEKEKKEHRGPVTIQYTLTSGLIIKYSDGRSAVEGAHSGSGVSLQQPRESVTYSAGSIND
ncbi:unnamed protein product [Adineta steineri]|uniref:Uncharacterized protein n=1 Tax=Adineta steineri TaxID=433720 RepID=A0A813YPA9_9BILA|nr:unnamed protein product [Adineta steineri]